MTVDRSYKHPIPTYQISMSGRDLTPPYQPLPAIAIAY